MSREAKANAAPGPRKVKSVSLYEGDLRRLARYVARAAKDGVRLHDAQALAALVRRGLDVEEAAAREVRA